MGQIQPIAPLTPLGVEPRRTEDAPAPEPSQAVELQNSKVEAAARLRESEAVEERSDTTEAVDVTEVDTVARYSIHKSTGVAMVKIIDAETGEVIAEYPSSRVLDSMSAHEPESGTALDKIA